MDIETKTAYIALETPKTANADELKRRQTTLNEELNAEIETGDNPTRIFELKLELEKLPIQILSAEIIEVRQKLKSIEDELEQNAENISLIEQIRVARKIELEQQLEIFKGFEDRYKTATFQLSVATINSETLRQSRREHRKSLEQLTEKMRNS
jgi:chromosome segregation ATPase